MKKPKKTTTTVHRNIDAKTGHPVSKEYAKKHPATTVLITYQVPKKHKPHRAK